MQVRQQAVAHGRSTEYFVSAHTDVGITKSKNQDSYTVKTLDTPLGRGVFAVLCDGMGGLDKGELASSTVVEAYSDWMYNELPKLLTHPFTEADIEQRWCEIACEQNDKLRRYGEKHNASLGTTLSVMLLLQDRYCILNVGDTRVYELEESIRQITEDQTVVAREVRLGNMTPEEAERDVRRNILLQCVGASNTVTPQMHFGDVKPGAVYLMCTDGFRHTVSDMEIFTALHPAALCDTQTMDENVLRMIELNKRRLERDNITVVLVRTQ